MFYVISVRSEHISSVSRKDAFDQGFDLQILAAVNSQDHTVLRRQFSMSFDGLRQAVELLRGLLHVDG